MSGAPARTHAPKSKAPEQAGAKPRRWKVVVDNTEADRNRAEALPDHLPLEKMRAAADLAFGPVPFRSEMEGLFGTDLGFARAAQGPDVDAALDAEGADAATHGDVIFLREAAGPDVVAHELTHVLQARDGQPVDRTGAEVEAARAERHLARGVPVPEVRTGLGPQDVAYRMPDGVSEAELVAQPSEEAAAEFRESAPDAAESAPEAEQGSAEGEGADVETNAEAGEAGEAGGIAAPDLGADVEENPVPTFELPPEPEIEIDEEAAAAAQAEAEAAFDAAEDADALMGALQEAPPSVKAMKQASLDSETERLSAEEQAGFDAAMPDFDAEMSGEDDLEAPAPVAPPGGTEAVLEDGTPAPAPEPAVDPTPDPGAAELNDNIRSILANFFGFGDAGGLGQAFDRVSTRDDEVDTSAGARPDVPLEGDTDPERVATQDGAAKDEARLKREEATQGVLDGPGPEQAQLQEMHEAFALDARAAPEIATDAAPVEGAEAFNQKPLDADVVALFDQHHDEAMRSNLTAAREEMDVAVADRDSGRDEKVAQAEADRDRLNAEADADQRDEIRARRQDIQDARQQAVDDQAGHVADMETQAELDRVEAEGKIEDKVTETETEVATSFDDAETRADDELAEGNRKADEERRKSEDKAEDQSWWDRATDWVAEQFDKLTSLINDIFDAVRSAVKDIIDAVKEAALTLIDAAANAIKSAIETFGEALKSAVNALLAEHFPEVAEALNNAIDGAVELAQAAVDVVAEGLKAGIANLLDALAAGIDAILAAYQAAVNAALAIARAALTGDWAALAKLVLEPILYALGIQPAAFYEIIARVEESLDLIIDDPLGFLSNLVDSVTGGIGRFADNFLTHLQAGIISWLTGALGGGITMPERWDLWGLLDLARQILGLTVDMMRRVAVRILGEAAVEKIEFFISYATELITGGWSALWEKIQEDLGRLKDTVLDQIKTFLVERIVMAAITWLVSLFNPVGALIKLVLTIWNFVMFLKDQLARIFAVAETIINTMWEIATGVLDPAMQGVERVLARLLPVAIDLLARLLGLGNVAGRVQRIIADVRQAIEDAIVSLIQRVVARFTGRGGGAGAEGAAPDGEAPGEIMRPVAVRGGGESHTLSIADQGETVVPMIRSTPMPLATWLDTRMGAPFDAVAEENAWQGEVRSQKRTDLQRLVDRAKEEEGLLDAEAEEAEDSLNEAGEENATPQEQTEAQSDVQEVAAQAEDTKSALEQVLEFFGIDPEPDLAEKYAEAIRDHVHPTVAEQLTRNVLPNLNARDYALLDWPEARARIAGETALPGAWLTPAARREGGTGGIIQRADEAGYRSAVGAILEAARGEAPTEEAITQFLDRKLTPALNTPAHRRSLLVAVLDGESDVGANAVNAVRSIVETLAAERTGLEYDKAFKKVTGTYYESLQTLTTFQTEIANQAWGKYAHEDDANVEGDTTGDDKPITFFVGIDAAGQSGSKRGQKNRERMAQAVRGARGRQHEWIPSTLANTIVETAANRAAGGNLDEAAGAFELIQFQHEVRTPTSKLIFRPGAGFPAQEVTITYKAPEHRESAEYADTPMSDLPDEERFAWYPPGGPHEGDEVGILQGHPGAISARVSGGAQSTEIHGQEGGHGTWNTRLTTEIVQKELTDGTVLFREVDEIGTGILSFYRETIWRGERSPRAQGGRFYFEYFASKTGSGAVDYGTLKTRYASEFETVYQELSNNINTVRTT
ncbi:Phage-related protein [Roseivivax lentus]|uniref:Phage-related protein n=1 Tax=Roseivivax lentus TaxID=633194 RepID=A0A1N7NUE5_9RHOB|nr:DUF4157 domain-containing protein [Roseivivax lentus]SIT01908.1 Phage-related protein [Roseivivax lentus]